MQCSGTFTKNRAAKIGRPIFALEEESERASASCLALFLPFVPNPFVTANYASSP